MERVIADVGYGLAVIISRNHNIVCCCGTDTYYRIGFTASI